MVKNGGVVEISIVFFFTKLTPIFELLKQCIILDGSNSFKTEIV